MTELNFEDKVLEKFEIRRQRKSYLNRILEMYSLFGILLALGSLILWGVKKLEDLLSFEDRLFFLVAVLGLSISFFSAIFLYYKKRLSRVDRTSEDVLLLVFLREWNNFERTVDKLVDSPEASSKLPIGKKIDYLLAENKINEIDAAILISALQIRNRIVHGDDKIAFEKGEFLLRGLGEIIDKIKLSK